jgi:hypothetical protein
MCGRFRPLENLLVMCQAQIAFHGVGFQPQRLLTPSREAFGALYRAKPVNYGLSFFSSSPHTQPFFPLAEISGVMQLMNVFSLFRLADSQRCPSECSQTLSQVKKKKKKKQQPMVAGGELRYLGSVVAPPLPLRRSSRLRSSVSVRFYENANSFGDRTYTTQPSDMSVDAMKIKREFEAFRECFDAIPDTLNRMPKMNPHGKDPLFVCVCVCVCVSVCVCVWMLHNAVILSILQFHVFVVLNAACRAYTESVKMNGS